MSATILIRLESEDLSVTETIDGESLIQVISQAIDFLSEIPEKNPRPINDGGLEHIGVTLSTIRGGDTT